MDEQLLDQKLFSVEHKPIFKLRPIIIWGSILGLGILFRFIHWPGSALLILTSTGGLQAYNLIGVIYRPERNRLNITLSTLGFIWILIMIAGIVFNDGYPYNLSGFGAYCTTLTLYFVIYYLLFYVILVRRKHAKNY